MRPILCILITCAWLCACASKVTVTDHQRQLAAQLSPQDAEAIVKRVFAKTDEQSGLFASSAAAFMTNPNILKIDASVVHYAPPPKPGVIPDTSGTATSVFQFDLRALKSISLVSKTAVNPQLIRSRDGTQFALVATDGTLINVDVKREYVDDLIAVAKYYSPKAF